MYDLKFAIADWQRASLIYMEVPIVNYYLSLIEVHLWT